MSHYWSLTIHYHWEVIIIVHVLIEYLTNSGYRILSGFDHKTMSLMVALEEQSPDIASGVWQEKDSDDTGAGDQVGGGGQSQRSSYSNMQHAWKTVFLADW